MAVPAYLKVPGKGRPGSLVPQSASTRGGVSWVLIPSLPLALTSPSPAAPTGQ